MTQKRKHYSKQFKVDAIKLVTEQGYKNLKGHTTTEDLSRNRFMLYAGLWELAGMGITSTSKENMRTELIRMLR